MADEMTQSTPQQDMQGPGSATEETARTGPSGSADSGERAQKTEAAEAAEPGTAGEGGGGADEPPDEEQLEAQMREIEEDPPEKLEDWPDGPAKYKTFGGPEGDHSYEEGPERKLGPSSLRRHEDGSIEIEGEKVDNPDDYKREPISDPVSQTASGDEDGEESAEES